MVEAIKANIRIIKKMEMEYSFGPMAVSTMDNGPKINKMEKEYTLAKANKK